ncbi:AI-2E family transporter [Lachnospiraceae bacterium LCP25S3_G4]
MDLNKENMNKIRGLIILTIVILVGLWKYEMVLNAISFTFNIIFPFVLGAGVAFVLNVPMSCIERNLFLNKQLKNTKFSKKVGRPLSLLMTLFLVIGAIAVVMFVVIPQLGTTFVSLGHNVQTFVPEFQSWCENMFRDNQEIVAWIQSIEFNWDKIVESSVNFFKAGAGNVLDMSFSAAKSIISGVTTFFIAFVFACYILLQKERLTMQIRKVFYAFMSESLVKNIWDICSLTYKTFSNFLTGQCVEASILGMMFFIVMTVFQLPYAMLVGILIAFTALIPIFGAFIGCAVGAFLILMVNPMQALVFVILFLVLQQVEGNLIYPHVVGNSVGLPSIWVLVAVSVGASLMGIVGMLIFIPLTSVLYTLFREYVYERLKKKRVHIS